MQRLTTYTPILFPFPTPKCEESESIETKIRTRMSDDRIISSNNNNTINPSKQRTRTRARSPSRSPTSTSTPVSGSPSSRRALDHDQQPGRLFSATGCSITASPLSQRNYAFRSGHERAVRIRSVLHPQRNARGKPQGLSPGRGTIR